MTIFFVIGVVKITCDKVLGQDRLMALYGGTTAALCAQQGIVFILYLVFY